MAQVHKVVKGDTLWNIVKVYAHQLGITDASNDSQIQQGVNKLVDLNNITNPNYIVVGQKIKITGTKASEDYVTPTAVIKTLGVRSDQENTIYATWIWNKDITDHYEVEWYTYGTDKYWFLATGDGPTQKDSSFTIPNPEKVSKVRVRVKPISAEKPVANAVEKQYYFTAPWSDYKTFDTDALPPKTPTGLSVSIKGLTLTATVENVEEGVDQIIFQVVKNNKTLVVDGDGEVDFATNHAQLTVEVDANAQYKVRCRACKRNDESGYLYSDWSDYTSNIGTIPKTPTGLKVSARSKDSITVSWTASASAETYTIEYTDDKTLFGISGDINKVTTEGNETTWVITPPESNKEWFFRVCANNDGGSSAFSGVKSIKIGTKPAAPTIWSSSNTAVVGDNVTLYWTHNSEDGSKPSLSEIYINGSLVYTMQHIDDNQDDNDELTIYSYELNTTPYQEGAKLEWHVVTYGIADNPSDPSMTRQISIHALPDVLLILSDNDGRPINADNPILTSFPMGLSAVASPQNEYQWPISYHVTIVANDFYESVDEVGNTEMVNAGDTIYSKYFDISDVSNPNLDTEITASDVTLKNGYSYTLTCVVAMSSGMTTTESRTFTANWATYLISPSANISFNENSATATIIPYLLETDGTNLTDATLSVYRREFDGSFTAICTNVPNNTSCIDPHPALDYARYRIVAKNSSTGALTYTDTSLYIGVKYAIIQWSEEWNAYNNIGLDTIADGTATELDIPAWSGSLLKLHYNIDVSNNNQSDVELVEYIGRKRPVSYYGTLLGETESWNVVIPKDDKETLYALRRLAIWMGDVYVREPSGSGFWANITVSFSQKHLDPTIPVTIEITRVEGGA